MKKKSLTLQVIIAFLGLILTLMIFGYTEVMAQQSPSISSTPGQRQTITKNRTSPIEKPKETSQDSLKTPPNLDKPTEVGIGFYLTNITRINQSDETFDISGYLSATWQDKRLAFDPNTVGDTEIRYTPEKIWEPALTIVNSPSGTKKGSVELTAHPDGTVNYLEMINATVSSNLNLIEFPFDSQTAKVVLESLSFDDRRLVFKKDSKMNGYSKDSFVSLSEWQILGFDSTITPSKFELEGKTYSRYIFDIKLQRNYQYYIFKVFIPLLLITLISWTTFWMNPNSVFATQMSVGLTSTLTAITFNFTVAHALPRVPYMTLMDAYIFICYLFFFSSIVANVTLHYLLTHSKQPETVVGLLHKCRWIFPAAFIFFQVATMTIFLVA